MGKQNNIQKKLRGTESELPQEYSWENMQEGIFAKMETSPQTVAPFNEKKKRRLLPYLLLFGIFLMATGTYYLWNQSNQGSDNLATQPEQNREIQIESNSSQKAQSNKNTELNQPQVPTQSSLESQSESKNKTSTKEVKREESISRTQNSIATQSILNNDVKKDTELSRQLAQSDSPQTSLFVTKRSQQAPSLIASKKNEKKSAFNMSNTKVANLGSLPMLYSELNHTFTLSEETLNTNLSNLTNEIHEKQEERKSIKVVASFGGNLYSHNYSGNDLARARTANLSPIIGQSASLSMEYPLNQRWAIQTGFSIDRSLTKLEYTGVMDTIIKADVTTHNHNNASGVISTTVSQNDINGTFITDVVLYNKYLSIGLPVSVKRYFSLGKVDLGIGAGLEYNYQFNKNGRYLVDPTGVSTDYQLKSHSDNDSFNSHLLSGLVSLNLDYQFNKGVGIGLGIDGTYGISNAVSEKNLSSNPMRLRSQIRMFKTF